MPVPDMSFTFAGAELPTDVVQGEMRLQLERHTDTVGSVCWNTEDVIYSGSWDRSVHKVSAHLYQNHLE